MSSIFKMGLGTVIMGIGFIFMIGASFERITSEIGKSSMHWLIIAYLFHTIGELFISPVSLAFITKVSPKRIVSSMMGIFWAVTGVANLIAAQIGKQSINMGELAIFKFLVFMPIITGLLLMLFSSKITKLTHGIE
jgi:POT family proton-dependent oligopeptide transporter